VKCNASFQLRDDHPFECAIGLFLCDVIDDGRHVLRMGDTLLIVNKPRDAVRGIVFATVGARQLCRANASKHRSVKRRPMAISTVTRTTLPQPRKPRSALRVPPLHCDDQKLRTMGRCERMPIVNDWLFTILSQLSSLNPTNQTD